MSMTGLLEQDLTHLRGRFRWSPVPNPSDSERSIGRRLSRCGLTMGYGVREEIPAGTWKMMIPYPGEDAMVSGP